MKHTLNFGIRLLKRGLGMVFLGGLCQGAPMVVLDVSEAGAVEVDGSDSVLSWQDLSGSGFDAVPSNAEVKFPSVQWVGNGHEGIGMDDSTNASLRILTTAQANTLMDFTSANRTSGFSAFLAVKVKSLPSTKGTLLGTASNPSSGGFAIQLDSAGRVTASLGGNSVASAQGGDPLLSGGDTVIIGVVYNAEAETLSVIDSLNGTVRSLGVGRGDFTTNKELLLGESPVSGNGVSLVVAEVQVYDRPLSTAQLLADTETLVAKWGEGSAPLQHLSVEEAGDVQAPGGSVTQWTDRSAFGNHAIADSGALAFPGATEVATGVPMMGADSGSESLRLFDAAGQDDWLDFAGDASGNSGFTVFLAFKPSSFVANWNDLLGNDSAFSRGFVLRTSGAGQPVVSLGGTDLRASTTIQAGDTVFYAVRYDAAAGEYLFWNSKNKQTLVRSLAPADFSSSGLLRLGRADNSSRHFRGDFLEVKVFDARVSDARLEQEKARMAAKWLPTELPVEVLGAEGTTKERYVHLDAGQIASAESLWFQVNALTYQNKGSIRVNEGEWLDLNHGTTEIQYQEMARGGMVHGGFNTIRFKVPATGLKEGLNRIQFRFNVSDTISIGYRVIHFEVLDAGDQPLLPSSKFRNVDPADWQAPISGQSAIDEGEALWRGVTGVGSTTEGGRGRQLWNHHKAEGNVGWWYGYDLPVRKTITASCSDCHTQDGRDLEMFSYSNFSIIERAKFHNLTEDEGRKIASYIRSLSGANANVDRAGRPWNPPYQPGPSIASRPIHQWAAGAGLEAVLDDDSDMAPYLFPNGMGDQELDDFFDTDGNYDSTLLPLAIQFPDWKHWLPMVHPRDAYTGDSKTPGVPLYYDGSMPRRPRTALIDFRNYLESIPSDPAQKVQYLENNRSTFLSKHTQMNNHFRFFFAEGTANQHWRSSNGYAEQALPSDLPREFAATSLSRLLAVRNFESFNEFNLQDKAHLFTDNDAIDHPQPRQWVARFFSVYTVGPHFQASVSGTYKGQPIPGISEHFFGQSRATGNYESTNWYELQAVLNAGHAGLSSRTDPVDYNYQHPLIRQASQWSGILEPFRYLHTANRMYQTKIDSGSSAPDIETGFVIRNMGPWYLFPSVNGDTMAMMAKLDELEPGLSARMISAHLAQFNEEVSKPEYAIEDWDRRAPDEIENGTTSLKLDLDKGYYDPDPDFWSWSDRFYRAIPDFAAAGTDPIQLQLMIDWCMQAWPNMPWQEARYLWTATASHNGTRAARALDGDLGTRWDTGTGQASGQWFQVDLGSSRTFDEIELDQGSSGGDWPRGYQVQVSNDGISWSSSVATGVGTSNVTTIGFASQTARYFRITQTGSSGPYWSIHELSVLNSGVELEGLSGTSLPGRIQAENFDQGGAGVAYQDTSAGNSGGKYRSTDVDIVNGEGLSYAIGYVEAGEWLGYTAIIPEGGYYDLTARVSAGGSGNRSFHLEQDGVDVSGPIVFNTGGAGWDAFEDVRIGVMLAPGTSALKVVMDTGGFNLEYLQFDLVNPATTLPGLVEAEDFDEGEAGTVYSDTTPANQGGAYRDTEVDIQTRNGGGYNVGWTEAGEFLAYTVNVDQSGYYQLTAQVAAASALDRGFHIESDGFDISGPIVFNTGGAGWQSWQSVEAMMPLAAGVQELKFVFDTGSFNLDSLQFELVQTAPVMQAGGNWVSADIGSPALAGTASYDDANGVFLIEGGGNDIWGTSDKFQYLHRNLTGDGEIVMQVGSVEHTHEWAKAGVMIRESLAPGAKHVSLFVSGSRGITFSRRATTNGASSSETVNGLAAPYFIRLRRVASDWTASTSPDGVTWTDFSVFNLAMARDAYIGMAVTSHDQSQLATASFDEVHIGAPDAFNSIEVWREQYFSTISDSGIASDNEDADNDGESNFLEYASGQDPFSREKIMTPISMTADTVSFTYKRSEIAVADGVNFQVEWSDTLEEDSWRSDGVSETSAFFSENVQEVTASVPHTGKAHLFMRLRVTRE